MWWECICASCFLWCHEEVKKKSGKFLHLGGYCCLAVQRWWWGDVTIHREEGMGLSFCQHSRPHFCCLESSAQHPLCPTKHLYPDTMYVRRAKRGILEFVYRMFSISWKAASSVSALDMCIFTFYRISQWRYFFIGKKETHASTPP